MVTDKITVSQKPNSHKTKSYFCYFKRSVPSKDLHYTITSEKLGQLASGTDYEKVIALAKKNYRIKVAGMPGDVYWSGSKQCFLVLFGYNLNEMSRSELATSLYQNSMDEYAKNIPSVALLPPFEIAN